VSSTPDPGFELTLRHDPYSPDYIAVWQREAESGTAGEPIDSSYSRKGIQMYDIISITIGGVISLPIVGVIMLISAVF
jgi:hypothetical protein